jgi:hypothetical protein
MTVGADARLQFVQSRVLYDSCVDNDDNNWCIHGRNYFRKEA